MRDHPRSSKTDPCHVFRRVRQQADECGQQRMALAIRSVMCHRVLWSIEAHPVDCHASANIRGNETSGPGLPNQQSPQPKLLLRPCRQYLPQPHLFILLGLGSNPFVGATIGLRTKSCWSSVCKLLNGDNALHQFSAAAPTRSRHHIHHRILIGRHHQTHRDGRRRGALWDSWLLRTHRDGRIRRATCHNGIDLKELRGQMSKCLKFCTRVEILNRFSLKNERL